MVETNKNRGICQQQPCEDAILEALLNEPLSVGQLVEKIHNSKTTVLKYYKDLMKEGLLEYKDKEKVLGSNVRVLCLTKTGENEAKRKGLLKVFQSLPLDFLNEFITNAKFRIIQQLNKNLCERLPKTDDDPFHVSAQSQIFPHNNDDIEKYSQALEIDLQKLGFSKEDILELWIIENGFFALNLLEMYGCPNYLTLLPLKIPNRDYSEGTKRDLLRVAKKKLELYQKGSQRNLFP